MNVELTLAIVGPWVTLMCLGILVVVGRVRVDIQVGARAEATPPVLQQIEEHLDRIHHQQRDALVRTGENTMRLRNLERSVGAVPDNEKGAA